ncbi:hypothetical protein E8E14_004396 [Neopestalotiopsis sp. 37M]|nr:hypothetical protein E8E14_004396 [Neopestalotiopsis sp. 37M]
MMYCKALKGEIRMRKVSHNFRQDCDNFAKTRFPEDDIQPVPAQGYCSYTVFIGTDKVVQFRPPDHGLDLEITSTACHVFGDIVPKTEFLGVVNDEKDGTDLHAYSMTRLQGTSLVGVRHADFESARKTREARRKMVKDFSRLQATSWNHRKPSDQVSQKGLVGSSLVWRAKLLKSALPERFNKFASSNLANWHEIERLPWTLTHGDFIPSNILVHTESGSIIGLLDWAEAEWLPFGVGLYGLEELLGAEVDGTYTYYPEAKALRRLFWNELLSLIPDLRDDPRLLAAVREAQVLGILLWHGIAFDDGRLDRVVEENIDDGEIRRLDAMLRGTCGVRSSRTWRERLFAIREFCGLPFSKW